MTDKPSHRRQGFIGVDVGTGSARAGVFAAAGALLAAAKRPITLWHEPGDIVEQSGDEIWRAVSESVREAVAASGLAPGEIAGIGFDATCSLVAVKADGAPVPVGPSGDPRRNVIVWMDHRATAIAEEINAGRHKVLDYVGGRISPEMETPKLAWLQRNLPASFAAADHFFDLSDYLTWRSTGSTARSVCTVTCKWTYLAHENAWDADYFRAVGLGVLADEGFRRIGTEIVPPGTALGAGLTAAAARDLGLAPGTPVAAALIDAHAGGIGTLGVGAEGVDPGFGSRLAYIFGTSACSMASAPEPLFVNGVWGPYYNAMVPGLWLTEGGQSAAGAALDQLVLLHPAAAEAAAEAEKAGVPLVEWLTRRALDTAATPSEAIDLAGGLHVVPEFLGNRSPFADPDARAVVAGLGLDRDMASLVALYVAGLSGIGYGLRQLLDRLRADGIPVTSIIASGGAARSPLVCQMIADATRTVLLLPEADEPVIRGAAMLAAVAAGAAPDLGEAMQTMSGRARAFHPADGPIAATHDRRYKAFEILQQAARAVRRV